MVSWVTKCLRSNAANISDTFGSEYPFISGYKLVGGYLVNYVMNEHPKSKYSLLDQREHI